MLSKVKRDLRVIPTAPVGTAKLYRWAYISPCSTCKEKQPYMQNDIPKSLAPCDVPSGPHFATPKWNWYARQWNYPCSDQGVFREAVSN